MTEKKFKILIVDDNSQNLQVLGNLLEKNNYNVEYAISGKEALEWINSDKFDLILLDVMMPEMDGFETCENIRKNKEYDDVPIIFLTAKTDRFSIIKGFELNAQDYINKPFDTAELTARIKTHLELKDSKDKLKNVNLWLEQTVEEKTKELKDAHSKLEVAYSELQNLDKMKSYFLNVTSSEIRGPLASLIGTLHLLKNQEIASSIKDLLDLLEKSVTRLENFAFKAILTTELNSNTYNLNLSEIALNELIQYCLLDLNGLLNKKQIQIVENFESDKKVPGDKDLIYKVLIYILNNAIIHSPESGKIEINIKSVNNRLICSFYDSGKGFSEEAIDSIYSPFRFNEKEFHENNELSMYLVKIIMEAHNGALIIKNKEKGGGSVELVFNLDVS